MHAESKALQAELEIGETDPESWPLSDERVSEINGRFI